MGRGLSPSMSSEHEQSASQRGGSVLSAEGGCGVPGRPGRTEVIAPRRLHARSPSPSLTTRHRRLSSGSPPRPARARRLPLHWRANRAARAARAARSCRRCVITVHSLQHQVCSFVPGILFSVEPLGPVYVRVYVGGRGLTEARTCVSQPLPMARSAATSSKVALTVSGRCSAAARGARRFHFLSLARTARALHFRCWLCAALDRPALGGCSDATIGASATDWETEPGIPSSTAGSTTGQVCEPAPPPGIRNSCNL